MNTLKISTADGELTEVGWQPPEHMDYTDWQPVGKKLAAFRQRSTLLADFAIGDWLNYGEVHYGETYAQAADETGLSPDQLMILKHVSSKVQFLSRNKNLSWRHHKEVAKLDDAEQKKWLKIAEKRNWTVSDLIGAMEITGLRKKRKGSDNSKVEISPEANFKSIVRSVIIPSGISPTCSSCGGIATLQVIMCQTCIDLLRSIVEAKQ